MFKKILLTQYLPRFQYLVYEYLRKNDMSQKDLAQKINMKESVLSMLLRGTRPLSANYLICFILGGIMEVQDVYQDAQPTEEREIEFYDFATFAKNREVQELLVKIAKLTGGKVVATLKTTVESLSMVKK